VSQPSLSADTILARLEKAEPSSLDDIYDLAQKQLLAEDAYSSRLDARATSLFGVVGFSMTVAFSFGGWALLDHVQKIPFGWLIAVTFVAILAVGLRTSWLAMSGLLVRRGYKFIDEGEVFHPQVLAEGKKRADYRIHLATHMWLVCQDREAWNQKRAKTIQAGQRWFFGFMLGILGLSILTTVSAIRRKSDPPTPCVCSFTSSSP
jgi:hypothetical protein